MDCLDRTNVVQSVFSRKIAHQQLYKLEQIEKPQGAPFEKFPNEILESSFKNVWTDNADAISILYTGTPALKTDFTRTGKRSYMGALNDAKNSITRYYINNFCDGYNHDCLDLAQKKLTISSNLIKRGWFTSLKLTFMSILAALYIASFLLATYFPYPEPELNDNEAEYKV